MMKKIILSTLILIGVMTSAQSEVTKAKAEYTYQARAELYAQVSTSLSGSMERFLVDPSVYDFKRIIAKMKKFNKVAKAYNSSEMALCMQDDACRYYHDIVIENGPKIQALIPLVRETAVNELNL